MIGMAGLAMVVAAVVVVAMVVVAMVVVGVVGAVETVRLAPWRIVLPRLVEAPRPQKIVGPQRFGRAAPGDRPARQQESFGEILPDQVEVVHNHHHRPFLTVPPLDEGDQVAHRLGVDGVEWLFDRETVLTRIGRAMS